VRVSLACLTCCAVCWLLVVVQTIKADFLVSLLCDILEALYVHYVVFTKPEALSAARTVMLSPFRSTCIIYLDAFLGVLSAMRVETAQK
jgi:hypothetical protein